MSEKTDKKKEEAIQVEGVILTALPNTQFKVKVMLGKTEHELLAYVSGNMRKNFIRIIPGDKVQLEVSPYDLTRGRIVYRMR